MNAGKSLRELLHRRKIKNQDFAIGVNCTPSYVCALINKKKWGGEMLEKTANFFNMSVSEFIEIGESER